MVAKLAMVAGRLQIHLKKKMLLILCHVHLNAVLSSIQ